MSKNVGHSALLPVVFRVSSPQQLHRNSSSRRSTAAAAIPSVLVTNLLTGKEICSVPTSTMMGPLTMAAIAAALIILCSLLPDDEVPIPWDPCKVLLWLVAQIASFPLFVSLVADVRHQRLQVLHSGSHGCGFVLGWAVESPGP